MPSQEHNEEELIMSCMCGKCLAQGQAHRGSLIIAHYYKGWFEFAAGVDRGC
jgi:hypothetical protein